MHEDEKEQQPTMLLPKFPSLPTDNLYKFMAITGLILFLVAPGYWIFLHSRAVPFLEAEQDHSVAALNMAADIARRDNQQQRMSSKPEQPRRRAMNESRTAAEDRQRLRDDLKDSGEEIEASRKSMEPLTRLYLIHQTEAKAIALAVMLVGAILMVVGFWFWYVRVQKPLDRMLLLGIHKAEHKRGESEGSEEEAD